MLAGKKLLITGVITRDSIAFEVARQAQEAGAEVVLTGFGRAKRLTDRAAKQLPDPPDVLELDVNKPEDLEAVAAELSRPLGPGRRRPARDRLRARATRSGGNFLTTPAESAITAFQTSAYSFKALAVALADLYPDEGAAVVGMDFDAQVAWPVYDWMGVAKAALEATSRYLARDLGPRGVRVNLVSAGPIGTIAARGIPGFAQLADAVGQAGAARVGHRGRRPRRGRGVLPALRPGPRDHRRDPPRRRRLPRDGHAARSARRREEAEAVETPPVFLTGATGFLGMEVLARLLERGDDEVLCLVRAPDDAAAQERLDGVLATLCDDPRRTAAASTRSAAT